MRDYLPPVNSSDFLVFIETLNLVKLGETETAVETFMFTSSFSSSPKLPLMLP